MSETIYQTTYNGKLIEFKQNINKFGRSPIGIAVDGKEWGSPQGERFFQALLNDVQYLKNENLMLKRMIEEGIGFEDLINPDDVINSHLR